MERWTMPEYKIVEMNYLFENKASVRCSDPGALDDKLSASAKARTAEEATRIALNQQVDCSSRRWTWMWLPFRAAER